MNPIFVIYAYNNSVLLIEIFEPVSAFLQPIMKEKK